MGLWSESWGAEGGGCAAGIAVGLSQVSIILVKMSAGPNGLYSKQADGTRGYLL